MSRALGKDETIANVVIARVFLVARLASVWGVAGGPPLTTGTDPVNRPLGSGASHSLGMMLTVSGGWVGVSEGRSAFFWLACRAGDPLDHPHVGPSEAVLIM